MPEVNQLPCPAPDRHLTRGFLALWAVLVLALALRAAAVAGRWEQLSRDPDAYRLIAENLREHAVFSRSQAGQSVQPTAFRPPLYPLLLAALAWQGQVTPALVAGLHLVWGVLSVWLLWRVAQRWQLGAWSYLAALGVAVDPILLNQAAEVMTETTATLLAIAALLALTRMSQRETPGSALLAGLMLGLATLCRPTFLIWAALVCLWLTLTSRLQRRTIGKVALVLVGVLLALLPWIVRNQLALGKPIVATTHGGYTLLLGNNPPFYRHLQQHTWGSVWDAQELLPLLHELPEQDNELSTRPAALRAGPADDPCPAGDVRLGLRGACRPSLDPLAAPIERGRSSGATLHALGGGGLVPGGLSGGDGWNGVAASQLARPALDVGVLAGAGPDRCAHVLLEQHADARPGDAGCVFGLRGRLPWNLRIDQISQVAF